MTELKNLYRYPNFIKFERPEIVTFLDSQIEAGSLQPNFAERVIRPIDEQLKELPSLYTQDEVEDPTVYLHIHVLGSRPKIEWYIIECGGEIEGEDMMAFGYCDLGMGFPELGYVDIREIHKTGASTIDVGFRKCKLSEVRKMVEDKYNA